MLSPVPSLIERLRAHVRERPERPAVIFMDRGEEPTGQLSYAELDAQAGAVAAALSRAGLRGKPVLLALPPDLTFAGAFLGCLYAGAYAVTAPYPVGQRALTRIRNQVADVRPAAAFTSSDPRVIETIAGIDIEGGPLIELEAALGESPLEHLNEPAPEHIAFLQYTSGSTSRPKGVVVTHGNLAVNSRMLERAFGHDGDLVVVNWLPLHHDMGLIGSLLQALYVGGTVVSMPPHAFLQKPSRWLRAIDRFGAATSGAPNFAYDLCARAIAPEEFARLDLSRWTLAFCGSEPVRPRTMERFAAAAAPAGFPPSALYPCYGMAETTLYVCGGPRDTGVRVRNISRETVSCGVPADDTLVEIVDADGKVCPQGEVGEICISGPQVSPGFWSHETGGAVPDPDRLVEVNGRRYLRTGDSGAVIEGEIFVTGRLKDMIILRGMKIYAEDVEETVAQLPHEAGVARVAAFGTQGGDREHLIVVCELVRAQRRAIDQEALRDRLKTAIALNHGVLPEEVVFARPGGIPLSSSGKVQRGRTRDLYVSGLLARASAGHEDAPAPVAC